MAQVDGQIAVERRIGRWRSGRRATPRCPTSCRCPPLSVCGRPKRSSSAPVHMSSLKSSTVRRGGRPRRRWCPRRCRRRCRSRLRRARASWRSRRASRLDSTVPACRVARPARRLLEVVARIDFEPPDRAVAHDHLVHHQVDRRHVLRRRRRIACPRDRSPLADGITTCAKRACNVPGLPLTAPGGHAT